MGPPRGGRKRWGGFRHYQIVWRRAVTCSRALVIIGFCRSCRVPSSRRWTMIRSRGVEDRFPRPRASRQFACEVVSRSRSARRSRHLKRSALTHQDKDDPTPGHSIRVARRRRCENARALCVSRGSRCWHRFCDRAVHRRESSFKNAGHMPDSSVIADVSLTLQTILTNAFSTSCRARRWRKCTICRARSRPRRRA